MASEALSFSISEIEFFRKFAGRTMSASRNSSLLYLAFLAPKFL